MGQRRASWGEVLRALGEAFIEVLRAEMAVLAEQWKVAGILLACALALAGGALFSVFWLLGLLVLAAVDLVRKVQEWQLWQASLAVAALLLLLMMMALLVAWLLVRRLENPLDAVRERMNDHLGWWQDNLLEDDHRLKDDRAAVIRQEENTEAKGGNNEERDQGDEAP